ncbi:MAG: polyketide cyclase [Rhodospirillales bacterium 70-18]|nr:MAG: polyketide cyclase [Rhodospirillales bacterium 70-18]
MARMSETATGESQAATPLVIARRFAAPRALVFQAWSSAAHLKNWFCPEGFTVPEAAVDFRPGGVCDICMRSPEGQDFWSRGVYVEISPPERLVFTSSVVVDGAAKFTAHTTVTFEAEGDATRMTVRQVYDIHDPAFSGAVDGATEGWRTTLDRLEREVARIRGRSAVHASFTLERVYDAPPALVFRAFTDPAAKARWFAGGEGYELLGHSMDIRPGGRERASGRWASGTVSTFDAVYFDVVANERLVYAYEMHLDDRRISVSLATLQLTPAGAGTRLVVTEQGTFLDGYDDAGAREHGTGMLMDRLGASLAGQG